MRQKPITFTILITIILSSILLKESHAFIDVDKVSGAFKKTVNFFKMNAENDSKKWY